MNQHVKRQTATELKEAGFPAPNITDEQVWYLLRFPNGTAKYWTTIHAIAGRTVAGDGLQVLPSDIAKEYIVYAPTALDILEELGLLYDLTYNNVNKVFVVRFLSAKETTFFEDENPSEACAKAYIALRNNHFKP